MTSLETKNEELELSLKEMKIQIEDTKKDERLFTSLQDVHEMVGKVLRQPGLVGGSSIISSDLGLKTQTCNNCYDLYVKNDLLMKKINHFEMRMKRTTTRIREVKCKLMGDNDKNCTLSSNNFD